MFSWNRSSEPPLALTLAADTRLSQTDYVDDQVWELRTAGGEPAAVALETTYGLRANRMRLFPRFLKPGVDRTAPDSFHTPVKVQSYYPNYLAVTFTPFEGLDILAEYWVPESQVVAGRIRFTNTSVLTQFFRFELAALLNARGHDGNLYPLQTPLGSALTGQTGNLQPLIHLSGGEQSAAGPFPALGMDLEMYPGNTRQYTWVAAALRSLDLSIEAVMRTSALPWDAGIARVEIQNASDLLKISTGNPDWDEALAHSQKAAHQAFLQNWPYLPAPSFVQTRRPDQGYSARGDGTDHPSGWRGQTAFDSVYLAGLLLPGSPHLVEGLVRNFLAFQNESGRIDWRVGLGGQRSQRLAQPMLASLAVQVGAYLAPWEWRAPSEWRTPSEWQASSEGQAPSEGRSPEDGQEPEDRRAAEDELAPQDGGAPEGGQEPTERREPKGELELQRWYEEVYPGLKRFFGCWMDPERDADGDGLPEWENHLQAALEESPIFDRFSPAAHGVDTAILESPALAAMLLRECRSLEEMAACLGRTEDLPDLQAARARLSAALDATWDSAASLYHYRDSHTHNSLPSISVVSFQGPGAFSTRRRFKVPRRLVVRLETHEERTYAVVFTIHGFSAEGEITETLSPRSFSWLGNNAYAATHQAFLAVDRVEVDGLLARDKVRIFTPDFSVEDCSLFLPLWAGEPTPERAHRMLEGALLKRFWQPHGIPASPGAADNISLPWNQLVGEGLLRYGFRAQAAELCSRLLDTVSASLKRQRSVYQHYNARSGQPGGERGHIHGLAPLGLFLQVLGIRQIHPKQILIDGFNPFPHTVTVQYRKVLLSCCAGYTEITFPAGQRVVVDRPGLHRVILT